MTTGVHHEGKRRLSPGRVLFHLVALAAVGALLVFALAALSGVGHRWVDVFAHFTAPMLLATLALAAGLLALRRRRWAAAAGGVAVLLSIAVWPQWFPPAGRPEAGAATIRLYSANVWAGNRDTAAIAASIREARPDIVLLIELADEPASRLDVLLEGYPYRVGTPRLGRRTGYARSVIASRWPLTVIPDRPDGLHAVGARVETPLGPVNVVGVHLTRPWPFMPQEGQLTQTAALTDLRRSLDGPVIVAGDFNSVSSARIGRQVKADMGLIPAPGFPGTWPAPLPAPLGATIDQVWRTPDLALVGRRIGRATGSDHYPVVTEFTRAAD